MQQQIITENHDTIATLCCQHHVRSLAICASAVRGDLDPARGDVGPEAIQA